MMEACHAFGPGSSPGRRIPFILLEQNFYLRRTSVYFAYDFFARAGSYLTSKPNVTEEQNRAEIDHLLAALLDTFPASVIIHDFEGNFLYIQ